MDFTDFPEIVATQSFVTKTMIFKKKKKLFSVSNFFEFDLELRGSWERFLISKLLSIVSWGKSKGNLTYGQVLFTGNEN